MLIIVCFILFVAMIRAMVLTNDSKTDMSVMGGTTHMRLSVTNQTLVFQRFTYM